MCSWSREDLQQRRMTAEWRPLVFPFLCSTVKILVLKNKAFCVTKQNYGRAGSDGKFGKAVGKEEVEVDLTNPEVIHLNNEPCQLPRLFRDLTQPSASASYGSELALPTIWTQRLLLHFIFERTWGSRGNCYQLFSNPSSDSRDQRKYRISVTWTLPQRISGYREAMDCPYQRAEIGEYMRPQNWKFIWNGSLIIGEKAPIHARKRVKILSIWRRKLSANVSRKIKNGR